MEKLLENLEKINEPVRQSKAEVVDRINSYIEASGYSMEEIDDTRPWGAFFRITNNQADKFVNEFFPGLSAEEARLGNTELELSPKILLVSPKQRLSWQYHNRRAERWAFITNGAYVGSKDDVQGEVRQSAAGEVVQFAKEERHRLVGAKATYTVVAEIWQHTELGNPSDEDDIVRLEDDYRR